MLPHSHCILDMAEVSLSREGYTNFLGVPEELKVQQGDDVVLKCSASSSEEPRYFWHKEVRKPGECAVSSTCFWKVFSLQLPPSTFHATSLFFFLSLFSFWTLLALFEHSSNFLSYWSMSRFVSDFLKPLVSPSPVIFRSSPQKKCSVFK